MKSLFASCYQPFCQHPIEDLPLPHLVEVLQWVNVVSCLTQAVSTTLDKPGLETLGISCADLRDNWIDRLLSRHANTLFTKTI